MPQNPTNTTRASPIKSPHDVKERKKSLVDDLLFQQAAHELLLCSTLKRPPKNKLGGSSTKGSGSTKAAPGSKKEDWSFSFQTPGMNCITIGLPGKLIRRKRKGLWEVLFS